MIVTYKGYTSEIKKCPRDNHYCGRVLNIPDVVGFNAPTLEQAEIEFKESLDVYLDWLNEEPQIHRSNKCLPN